MPIREMTLDQPMREQLQALNLRESEYALIVDGLGRAPNFTELCMFSALWSEHCAYKHTRHLLKTLPTDGAAVLQGPGENAGIIDAGEGIAVAFKVESHNHPTYVEPFQGAATGVGGILRDIITMNARPIANLNALRFGPLEDHENQRRLKGAVAGIAHYGNCMGIPTIAGDTFIHPSYTGNPLVNAMSIGVMQPDGMMAAGAKGVGNPVLYVGSATGRDGMGGASFASKSLDVEASAQDRPAVQVGDPFAEKCLMEACLAAFVSGCVLSAQDMGAAGLTCATAEMAAKGHVGMRIDLDKVPAREPGMAAWEYLSSESQERFLLVLEKGKEQPVLDIFETWALPAVIIGEVIGEERIQVWQHGEQVVDVPSKLLTDDAPTYPPTEPLYEPEVAKARRERDPQHKLHPIALKQVPDLLQRLIAHSNSQSRAPIYEQYDRHIKLNTRLSSDHNTAGLLQLTHPDGTRSRRGLAASLDGNPLHVLLNPREGSKGVVAEAARNVAVTGAKPLALTNNLNFGNPETPEVAYQLAESVAGMREACLALETPVTGGNVSLYNTNADEAIIPSPTVGMVGVLNHLDHAMTPAFKAPGDAIFIIGRFAPSLGGSQIQALETGAHCGEPPSVDLTSEKALIDLITDTLLPQKLVNSIQDVSLGGLLPTLVKCCFDFSTLTTSATLDLNALLANTPDLRTALFGETHGSYLVSIAPEKLDAFTQCLAQHEIPTLALGTVASASEPLQLSFGDEEVNCSLENLLSAYQNFPL